MAIVNEGVGEVDGLRSRRFRRKPSRSGMGEVEGMGKRFKIKKAIKKVAKKAVTVNKAMMKNALAQAQSGAKIYMAAKTGNLNAALDAAKSGAKSYASLAKSVAGKKSGGGGSVVDYVSDVQAAPDRSSPSVVTQYVDRVVNALPEAMTEEVEEVNEETGKKEKVKKMKPVVKYGMIGGGVGIIGLIAYLLKKKKK